MLRSKIQAGNSSSAQAVRPTLISKTTAMANPGSPIHLGTTFARSVMVAVLRVNTAAIRIAYTCSRSPVTVTGSCLCELRLRTLADRPGRRPSALGWLHPAERIRIRLSLATDPEASAETATRRVRADCAARRLYYLRTALAACDRPARPGGLAARRVRRPSAGLGARWPGPDSPIRPSPPRSCVMSRC